MQENVGERKQRYEIRPDEKPLMKADHESLKSFKPELRIFMHRLTPIIHIYPGCYQLPNITKMLYEQLQKDYPVITKYISESVFAYYCAVVVYFRLLRLLKVKDKMMTRDELDFHNRVKAANLMVPTLLQDYISCLGDVTFYNGHFRERYDFTMLSIEYFTSADGSSGWFGKINANTHILYQMYPCLSVYARRIIQDLLYTAGEANEDWNLPVDVAPKEPNAGKPTKNLLGYAKAQKLTKDQVNFLQEGGVIANSFVTSNETLLLAMRLTQNVSQELVRNKDLQLNTALCKYRHGSVAQLPIHYVIPPKDIEPNYHEIDGPFIQMSKYKHPLQLHTAALKFQYQIRFNVETELNSWCIYSFNEYKEVPEAWREIISQANNRIITPVEFTSYNDAWKDLSGYEFGLNVGWRKRRGNIEKRTKEQNKRCATNAISDDAELRYKKEKRKKRKSKKRSLARQERIEKIDDKFRSTRTLSLITERSRLKTMETNASLPAALAKTTNQ